MQLIQQAEFPSKYPLSEANIRDIINLFYTFNKKTEVTKQKTMQLQLSNYNKRKSFGRKEFEESDVLQSR
jgi:hypothetical protein